MIGVGPQASRGGAPPSSRAVARLAEAGEAIPARGDGRQGLHEGPRSLAGAVAIGGMIGGTSATQEALRPVTVSHWCGASSGD